MWLHTHTHTKPIGDVVLNIGMRHSVTFPGLELSTSERNEDYPSGVFITISSASRLPHFKQDLLTKEIITLGFYFAQRSMEKNRLPNWTACQHVISPLFLNWTHYKFLETVFLKPTNKFSMPQNALLVLTQLKIFLLPFQLRKKEIENRKMVRKHSDHKGFAYPQFL